MGELDEISFKLGEISSSLSDQNKKLDSLVLIVGEVQADVNEIIRKCPIVEGVCSELGPIKEDVKLLKQKDAIGGTTKAEKAGLWVTVVTTAGMLLKIVFEAIF